jgi:hypothetical protein
MSTALVAVLTWFLTNAAARVLLGAGISVVSVAWVETVLNEMLANLASTIATGLPEIIMVCGLGGVWIAMSNIASAMLMRAAIVGAANLAGFSKK